VYPQILGKKYAVIGVVRQLLLDRARKMDVDYAFFVDDDIYIPYPDLITRITDWKKSLVGAPYPILSGDYGLRLSPIWINRGPEGETRLQRVKTVCDGFEEVYAVSGGLMCIGRELLMDPEINFLPLIFLDDRARMEARPFAEDIGYCHKARQRGYKVYVDGSMLLGHYVETVLQKQWHHQAWLGNSEFRYGKKRLRKGVVLMPDKYYEVLAKIDAHLFKRAYNKVGM